MSHCCQLFSLEGSSALVHARLWSLSISVSVGQFFLWLNFLCTESRSMSFSEPDVRGAGVGLSLVHLLFGGFWSSVHWGSPCSPTGGLWVASSCCL